MQNISKITPSSLKDVLKSEIFYPMMLKGNFGKPTGQGWFAWNGLCPFHPDRKQGSFYINKDNGAFKCFSCNAHGGDIIAFYQTLKRLGFKQTFKELKGVAQCEK